jgi:hypothetical protein
VEERDAMKRFFVLWVFILMAVQDGRVDRCSKGAARQQLSKRTRCCHLCYVDWHLDIEHQDGNWPTSLGSAIATVQRLKAAIMCSETLVLPMPDDRCLED